MIISYALIKILKFGRLAFLSFLFTSYISPGSFATAPDPGAGNYNLITTDGSNLELHGNILFDTAIERSGTGLISSVIQLQLKSNPTEVTHSMGFLISRHELSVMLPEGTYHIAKNSAGYFSNFDGVFAFANVSVLGELPFFAREGTIVISNIEQCSLEGSLEVKFRNADSKSLNIKGNFKAVKGILR